VPGHALTWLDVFTAVPLAGNGLCVLHDADDIDDATMQAIARETRLSETTFVQRTTRDGADYRNRIFTTREELPFAGHPSLGTAVAVARARGERRARYVQETRAGLQPIEVQLDGVHARASMLQAPATAGEEPDPGRLLAAVGLEPGDAHPAWRPQVLSTGTPHVVVPVRDAGALARAAADPALLPPLLEELGTICVYLAVVEGDAAQARSFFVGDDGPNEDPATGSAAGPLMAYVAARTQVRSLGIRQGEAMGRPSVLEARMRQDGIEVAGDVVVVAEGRTVLPSS
jgi:trans-2,3-dihydro-3-hydroxyanthranilate isomerase